MAGYPKCAGSLTHFYFGSWRLQAVLSWSSWTHLMEASHLPNFGDSLEQLVFVLVRRLSTCFLVQPDPWSWYQAWAIETTRPSWFGSTRPWPSKGKRELVKTRASNPGRYPYALRGNHLRISLRTIPFCSIPSDPLHPAPPKKRFLFFFFLVPISRYEMFAHQ